MVMGLTTGLWVSAQVRHLRHRNFIPATIVRRGDPDAGTVLLKLNRFEAGVTVYTQASTMTDDAGLAARGTGPEPVTEAEADADIARQVQYDPDVWVLEIEDRRGPVQDGREGRLASVVGGSRTAAHGPLTPRMTGRLPAKTGAGWCLINLPPPSSGEVSASRADGGGHGQIPVKGWTFTAPGQHRHRVDGLAAAATDLEVQAAGWPRRRSHRRGRWSGPSSPSSPFFTSSASLLP